jgi:hypothetical protein
VNDKESERKKLHPTSSKINFLWCITILVLNRYKIHWITIALSICILTGWLLHMQGCFHIRQGL